MANSNRYTRAVTGSATNTLGTLGRSIFNSTIGTFADSETMNQIYSAVAKLSNSIETTGKTIDNEALNGRNKPEDLFSLIAGLDIQSSYDFMNKNREFKKRLMRLNKQERDITLDALGVDVSGESNTITNEYVKEYDDVKGNNYLEDYVKTLPQNQQIGDETTTLQLESSTHFNYSGLHNDLYTVNQNLYPDDDNQGTFANKWIVENRNSAMYKTKKLFNSKKIGTIISRFHTDPNRTYSPLDNAKSKYGLSHGRNLLTKKAENGANSSYVSGYDNPYCRVWTHHHQYDRFYKTIRPFSSVDDQGNYDSTIGVQEFHQWKQFSDSYDTNSETIGKWGWKKDSNNGWKYSVLQNNGLVNITPKYIKGGDGNIHTKQCMFSIENLAWRGYDPYSFEQALSWEQRGPLGGRIMWFPPYGIQFQETTSTQWTNNTFLGRGEDVYTYTNTTRTGSLSFMMVVDHPSIIDYVTWTSANKNVNDTDILRFFAGCGEGGGDGLREYAKPTPLTDEYTQVYDVVENPEKKVKEVEKEPVESTKTTEQVLSFYVFYPNNYSGTYDDPNCRGGVGYNKDSKSIVQAIPYLLAGKGAQKNGTEMKDTFDGDVKIDEDFGTWTDKRGYEMFSSGLGNDCGYILGTSLCQNKSNTKNGIWGDLISSGKNKKEYASGINKTNCRKWNYRIDGRYKYPQSVDEEMYHYYNQKLENASGYTDSQSFGLNRQIAVLQEKFSDEIEQEGDNIFVNKNNNNNTVYTLAEMAYIVYGFKDEKIKQNFMQLDDNRTKELDKIVEQLRNGTMVVKNIGGVGYASKQGYTILNEELGKNRFYTAAHWFMENTNNKDVDIIAPTNGQDNKGTSTDTKRNNGSIKGDANTLNAKKWRYARVDITVQTTETIEAVETNTDNTTEGTQSDEKSANVVNNQGDVSYVGYTPTGEKGYCKEAAKNCDIYLGKDNKKWYRVENGSAVKFISVDYASEDTTKPQARYSNGGKTDENRLRYDQEYHFFKVLEQKDPLVYNSLMDKLQYFDPAFHSMTPEGFNGRLTFLQQCMRQGNTVSASDGKYARTANNLAFGRAPYCVLRLGDFYNQMIVIDNLSISYDPLVWDLNVEGIGVQPLIAHVQLSFKFVGGGDLTGPVRRLQNAMSFNYYANARLYDNRADRVERKWSDKTCGAIEHDEILDSDTSKSDKNKVSSFYNTQMYK